MTKFRKNLCIRIVCILIFAIPIIALTIRFVGVLQRESQHLRLPVLMYHSILPENKGRGRYTVSVEKLERQLISLAESGYESISLETLLKHGEVEAAIPAHPIVLTFDDGTIDQYLYAFPLLTKYGFTATFFVVTGWINHEGILSDENIIEMRKAGMSFGSHTHSHPFLDQLDTTEILYELQESKRILEQILNEPVHYLAIPGGWYSQNVLEIAENIGYKLICTSDPGTNSFSKRPYLIKRLEVKENLNPAEFADLWSPHRIAIEDTKRTAKLILHKILGSSTYAELGKVVRTHNRTFLVFGISVFSVPFLWMLLIILNRRKGNIGG